MDTTTSNPFPFDDDSAEKTGELSGSGWRDVEYCCLHVGVAMTTCCKRGERSDERSNSCRRERRRGDHGRRPAVLDFRLQAKTNTADHATPGFRLHNRTVLADRSRTCHTLCYCLGQLGTAPRSHLFAFFVR